MQDGELGELVLTNLGRTASPVIRYRTGDMVRARTAPCPTGPAYLWLDGGILARADDMVTIRGVNVYPTAVEAVVRAHADVTEFRATVARESAMLHLTVEIEVRPGADGAGIAEAVALGLKEALGLTVAVHAVAANALPRFEMKARRFVIADAERGRRHDRDAASRRRAPLPPDALVLFAIALLEAAGLPAERARAVAEILVEGDLLGHTTHGLDMLALYLKEIEQGTMAKTGEPDVVNDMGAALTWTATGCPAPGWCARRSPRRGRASSPTRWSPS